MKARTWVCPDCDHTITYKSTLILDHNARIAAQAHVLTHSGAA
ncbi:MAG: hypothetical protein ACKOAF_04960 [Actinomycetes bacterium]